MEEYTQVYPRSDEILHHVIVACAFVDKLILQLLCAHLLRIWLLCTCVMHGTSVYDHVYMCKDNFNKFLTLYVSVMFISLKLLCFTNYL